jgi:hypothetical protein
VQHGGCDSRHQWFWCRATWLLLLMCISHWCPAPVEHPQFGKVYKGLWRGTVVAVKTMVMPANMSGAEKREKMVGPLLLLWLMCPQLWYPGTAHQPARQSQE